jgi:hypothetical protein
MLFRGHHGWGYDGVDLYAVHQPYGGSDGLKGFVDACHTRQLAVLLDVVFNHLGPSGNYLGKFGPYFNSGGVTPWGPSVRLDRVRVRFDETARWLVMERAPVIVLCNFGEVAQPIPIGRANQKVLLASVQLPSPIADPVALPAGAVAILKQT